VRETGIFEDAKAAKTCFIEMEDKQERARREKKDEKGQFIHDL